MPLQKKRKPNKLNLWMKMQSMAQRKRIAKELGISVLYLSRIASKDHPSHRIAKRIHFSRYNAKLKIREKYTYSHLYNDYWVNDLKLYAPRARNKKQARAKPLAPLGPKIQVPDNAIAFPEKDKANVQ